MVWMVLVTAACQPVPVVSTAVPVSVQPTTSPSLTTPSAKTPISPTPQPTPGGSVPVFDHIIVILFENKDYLAVVGSPEMPNLNRLAKENSLLTHYYGVGHPSLPNYLALAGGDTFGVKSDCQDCFQSAANLADLIEKGGRDWKTYQESMPNACFVGSKGKYAQKHNPFIYFDNIRLDAERCRQRVVPMEQLDTDLTSGKLPDFAFISPNLCNSGHDCSPGQADQWLGALVDKLQGSPALGKNSLIVLTFDEASDADKSSCCGLPTRAGGHIATVLVSPLARQGFEDSTPYSHYSLVKTIAESWGLPLLGHAADAKTAVMEAPWKTTEQSHVGLPLLTSTADVTLPIRAAFYYPWFPEAWNQQGMNPFTRYHPSQGFYSLDASGVMEQQIQAMQYGHIQVGIASWWGQTDETNQRLPDLLEAARSRGFYWSIYYEAEGSGDPNSTQIRNDLAYIRDHYATDAAFLKLGGRFVVFVYADPGDGCGMVTRWNEANQTIGAYLVLKVFEGYAACPSQPDNWHQYAPATASDAQGTHSYTISPGFWKANESSARLGRSLNGWAQNVRDMLASEADFQLVTTFNEWCEGTPVESASEWNSTSGFGGFMDVLHDNGMVSGPVSPQMYLPFIQNTRQAQPSEAVLVGAGDIATCEQPGAEATAKLLDGIPGTVFTVGDNVYPDGTAEQFANCYGPTWGRHLSRTFPTPGNHEYHTAGASGYFNYFGAAAGESGKGYYSYDLGSWHIIALNSECTQIGGCGASSPQVTWLKADLAAHPALCTLAYWHTPRFSSGEHGDNGDVLELWRALYSAGADVVLNGHDHEYERFAPQNPDGKLDNALGIREFVVGMGGSNPRDLPGKPSANSQKVITHNFGVIKLTLRSGSYNWQFVPVAGTNGSDSGTGACH